jgi:hypothetical protein
MSIDAAGPRTPHERTEVPEVRRPTQEPLAEAPNLAAASATATLARLGPPWRPLTPIRPYERSERRIVPRHHLLMVGRIILGEETSFDCTVGNFSPAGAALWLKDAANLPVRFDLHFENATRHCIVVWRRPAR